MKLRLDQLTLSSNSRYVVVEEARPLKTRKRPLVNVQNHEGVAIIHRSTFRSSKISSLAHVMTFVYICCRIATNHSNIVVASIYRPGLVEVTGEFF